MSVEEKKNKTQKKGSTKPLILPGGIHILLFYIPLVLNVLGRSFKWSAAGVLCHQWHYQMLKQSRIGLILLSCSCICIVKCHLIVFQIIWIDWVVGELQWRLQGAPGTTPLFCSSSWALTWSWSPFSCPQFPAKLQSWVSSVSMLAIGLMISTSAGLIGRKKHDVMAEGKLWKVWRTWLKSCVEYMASLVAGFVDWSGQQIGNHRNWRFYKIFGLIFCIRMVGVGIFTGKIKEVVLVEGQRLP